MTEAHDTRHVDPVTGTSTTGHEWDGLTELNNPLPRWWLYLFYVCILWAVGYWVIYPAWPLVSSFTGGVLGWHSRSAIETDMATLSAARAPMVAKLAGTPIDAVGNDPALLDFTLAYARVAFKENCAPCHGAGGGGAVGYPNLIDDDWLWGGTIADIQQTVTHGVRNVDADSRQSQMPAFGRDGILNRAEIYNVAAYIRSRSGLAGMPGADVEAGARVFADNCAACHGDDARGKREFGAPDLTDAVWLYGSSPDAVVATVTNARNSSMPAWGARLDGTTVKALALYVHSLGGGE